MHRWQSHCHHSVIRPQLNKEASNLLSVLRCIKLLNYYPKMLDIKSFGSFPAGDAPLASCASADQLDGLLAAQKDKDEVKCIPATYETVVFEFLCV